MMSQQVWSTLFLISLFGAALSSQLLDVRLGFLTASRRLKGRHFVPIFNQALEHLNQNATHFKLRPVIAETHAKASESAKRMIEFLTDRSADFLLLSEESCRLESQLASVYNVALLSFNCNQANQATPSSSTLETATTLIQTKPPAGKIVDEVELLLSQLLSANNRQSYPQHLVLLYFKESPACAAHPDKECRSNSDSLEGQQAGTNDDEYRLIGESLERKLRVLLSNQVAANESSAEQRRTGASLSVLNWHSTYHYGRTNNPFRQLVRQSLVRSYKRSWELSRYQCANPSRSELAHAGSAIYIVVGHYDQHLGLMLALDELNLLQPAGDKQSFISTHPTLANQGRADFGGSLVIGVDIEQYDENDDSVRFLRGLLMDNQESRVATEARAPNLDLYRHYLAVVPARPSGRATDLLAKLRWHSSNQRQQLAEQTSASAHQSGAQPNQTLDSMRLTERLTHLVRLPIEAFYLYDALRLLHDYLDDCLRNQQLSLLKCREGIRTYAWFANRTYRSAVNQELASRIDEHARADGSFILIGRRMQADQSADQSAPQPTNDDELGLVPLGHFTSLQGKLQLQLSLEASLLDPVWLALWCQLNNAQQQPTNCRLANATERQLQAERAATSLSGASSLIALAMLAATLLVLALIVAYRATARARLTSSPVNQGWFDQHDEENFLAIVKHLLIGAEATNEQPSDLIELVDLHCFMFQFPSCRFVHWLCALLKLKELMFKYQSKQAELPPRGRFKQQFGWSTGNFGKPCTLTPSSAAFFRTKHEASGTLRLLLSKYKMLNERFVRLSSLSHRNVAALKGILLGFSARLGKVARLIIERSERGNLRQSLHYLNENLDWQDKQSFEFRFLMAKSCVGDILDGLEYLHKSSSIEFHGELRATTCLVSIDWRLMLSGFHASHMRRSLGDYEQKVSPLSQEEADCHLEELIYQAPEILANPKRPCGALDPEGLKLADIYSFAFLLYELLYWREPWSSRINKPASKCSRLLIERVKVDANFRPLVPGTNNSGDSLMAGSAHDTPVWPHAQQFTSSSTTNNDSANQSAATGLEVPKADSQASDSYPNGTFAQSLKSESLGNLIRSCWSQEAGKRPRSLQQLRHQLDSTILSVPTTQRAPNERESDKESDDSCCITAPTLSALPPSPSPYASSSSPAREADTFTTLDRTLSNGFNANHNLRRCKSSVIMELYTCFLEKLSISRLKKLREEHAKRVSLQYALVPGSVLSFNSVGNESAPRVFNSTSCCLFKLTFTNEHDGEKSSVESLNELLGHLDDLMASYSTQIHAFDSQADGLLRWLVIAGGPLEKQADSQRSSSYNSSQLLASFALQLLDLINRVSRKNRWQVKCALHYGPVLGAVLFRSRSGHDLARYVLLGDALKVLDAIETSCPNQRIQVSSHFYSQLLTRSERKLSLLKSDLRDNPMGRQGYVLIKREGKIAARGVGDLETYWLLNGPKLSSSQSITLAGF